MAIIGERVTVITLSVCPNLDNESCGHTERKDAEMLSVGRWVSPGFFMGMSICRNT